MSDQGRDERIELNNQLVVPAYRAFCAELGLPFHFWDELPRSAFDAEIARGESQLHHDAMDIFNRLKPEFVMFKGDVVRFHFTVSDGEFDFEKTPAPKFLSETADKLFYLQQLEHRFDALCNVIVGVVSFLVYATALWMVLPWAPLGAGELVGVAALTAPALVGQWAWRALRRLPRQCLDDGLLNGLAGRVLELRRKLVEVHGSRPNTEPNRGILAEPWEPLTDDDIGRAVRRLHSGMPGTSATTSGGAATPWDSFWR